MGWVGMCLHYTCSIVLFEFLLCEKVLPGADRMCWPQNDEFEHWPWSVSVTQSQGGGKSVSPPLHSESMVSAPVQQEGHLTYAPFWCLWTPEDPSQRPQVANPAKMILWVTKERQGSCSHKCLSISHLVFNRPCAGVKPSPSLSPGHRHMLSLP